MRPEAQRIAIAEACGWRFTAKTVFTPQGGEVNLYFALTNTGACCVPDYLGDLNAMNEAEKFLVSWDDPKNKGHYIWKDSYSRFIGLLGDITNSSYFHPKADSTEFRKLISATAAQRAEAFLKTIGKWTE